MSEENSVLRWGGLAGILGGILLVAVFVIVGVFVGAPAAEPAETVMRFPDVRAAHIVEEVLYLGVLALWAVHFLALYRALRATSLAPALFGSALGILVPRESVPCSLSSTSPCPLNPTLCSSQCSEPR